jgi:uncharacterized membrane protein YkoI
MIMKRSIPLAAAAALAAAIGGAHAATTQDNDALAIGPTPIGLAQAVTAAEHHAGGKASRAEFERHNGRGTFDVEVVAGLKVMDVEVDSVSGKVLAATEDKVDHDDRGDTDE